VIVVTIHDDISLIRFVIPGLTRNPVFFWIPTFAGMTAFAVINVAVCSHTNIPRPAHFLFFYLSHVLSATDVSCSLTKLLFKAS